MSIFSLVSNPARAKQQLYKIATSLLLLILITPTLAATLPIAQPATVGMSAERLAQIDQVVQQAIERKETPGAVVLVGRRGRVVWRRAYGARAVEPAREGMTTDTIFDLASLTKIVATATSIMILVERGQVRLNDPLVRYLPEMKGAGGEQVTIEQLLTHRSGFAPDFDLSEQWTGYTEAIKHLATERLRTPPGARFVYSDINYIALGELVHRASGMMLDEFARRNIYEPLAIFCQMILNGGSYNGVRILSPMGVAAMTRPRAVEADGTARGLGWDIASGYSSNRGDIFPLGSFGHTGFTGTSIWIDPASETF